MDSGKAIAISFREFFIDDYFSDCYSYVAVSNKVYSATFVCASQIKRVAASDWLSWWEFIIIIFHLFSVNLCTRYGKSHIGNSKSYS